MADQRQSPPRRLAAIGRLLTLLVVLGVVVLGPARAASAHAELLATDPVDGSLVQTAPQQVTLQFSEDVAVQPDGVRVLDADAGRVEAGQAKAAGNTVTVPLKSSVPDGSYVVAWRVISADGHPVRGAFNFSIGSRTTLRTGLANDAFANSADRRDDVSGAVLRAIAYIAILATSGAVWVGAALRRDHEPPPVGRAVTIAGSIGLAAVLLEIPVQASLATGQGWGSIREEGVASLALADGVGWSLAITGIGLLALLITSGLPFKGAARRLALGGAALAPLGLVVTGHTRTMSPAVVGFAADAAHVVAGAIWFGGLGALLLCIRRRRAADDARGAAEAVASFSGWAGVTVGVVIVAGTVMGWIEVGGLHALTSTTYGQLLLAKVALVGLVLVGAAWNRFRLVPAIEAQEHIDEQVGAEEVVQDASTDAASLVTAENDRTWRRLAWVMRAEVIGLVAVLCVTAVLTNSVPARTAVGSGIQSVSAPFGKGTMQVVVDPARPGRNDIHAYLLDENGRPDDRFQQATIALELPAEDIGPLDKVPVRAGPGHFQLVGTPLELAGEWTLTLTVKPDRFTEQSSTVRFRVR